MSCLLSCLVVMFVRFAAVLFSATLALHAQSPNELMTPEQLAQSGSEMSAFEAADLEKELVQTPGDLSARAKLIGYYFYQWMQVGEENAKAQRRKHVLWTIQHHPDSTLAGLYEFSIDPRGHQMADPKAYEDARKLWLQQMQSPAAKARTLGNIGRFFQLNDRELSEKAFQRAQQMEPTNAEWDWRLGYLYGLAILGVDGLAFNGQPASIDPLARNGPFAAHARQVLNSTPKAMVTAVGADVLFRYGTMLAPTETARLEFVEQAHKLFSRAAELEPKNPTWTKMVRHMEAMKAQLQNSPLAIPRQPVNK